MHRAAALRAQHRRACARHSISNTSETFGSRVATTEKIWTLGGQHPAGDGLTKDPSAVKLFRTPFTPHPPRLLLSLPKVNPRSVTTVWCWAELCMAAESFLMSPVKLFLDFGRTKLFDLGSEQSPPLQGQMATRCSIKY